MTRSWFGAVLLAAARIAGAQTSGQAEVAAQGYYLRNTSQPASQTTGALLNFEEFVPGLGLLRGNLEGYGTDAGVEPADNYLELRGAVWGGLRWNVTAGDFRRPASVFRSPFTNLVIPEIDGRGFNVEAGDSKHGYSLFWGHATALAGPRIPFRITVPQTVAGATFWRSFGNLQTGVRFLRFEKTDNGSSAHTWFAPGRDFQAAENISLYATYRVTERLQWYSEATAAHATSNNGIVPGQPVSYLFGPAWESDRITVRANYANLGRSYFPLAGYWTGDRRGPFGELRFRPFARVELFASAADYTSTSKAGDKIPVFRSASVPTGASVALPWKLTASAQLSTGWFSSTDPVANTSQKSHNRQWIASLSRPVQRHSLRFMTRDMRLTVNGAQSRERSSEVEDTFQAGRFSIGGAVRVQRASAADHRTSLYTRASAQWSAGRLTASGYFERGTDLANQTVFATSSTNATVLSAKVRIAREWSIQGEAFRTRLISELNPENLFVQSTESLATNALLSRFQQWTFLFRVGRTFHWGGSRPGMESDQYTAQRIPITGSVEGIVYAAAAGGRSPVPDVPLSLETGRSVRTDARGRYRFADVPEGGHTVSIDLENLAADYNPGPVAKLPAIVTARKTAVADFELSRLGSVSGRIVASGIAAESVEGIVIRLEPGGVRTSSDKTGAFAFHNVAEGSYHAVVDESTLPHGMELKGGNAVRVTVGTNTDGTMPTFEIRPKPAPEKPVRRMFESVIPLTTGR